MRSPVATALLVGCSLLSLGSARAAEEITLPEVPEVSVSVPAEDLPVAASAPASALAEIALPDIAPPDLPAAPAIITAQDRLSGALASQLQDEGAALIPRLSKREREAIAAFYALGDYRPLWLKDGALTPAARAVAGRLKAASEDGLDPSDYPVPSLAPGAPAPEIARAELALSAAAVLYARDARGARIEPARLSRLITPTLELPAGDAVLTRLAAAPDPGRALGAFNPPHAGYAALRRKLAELRAAPGAPPSKIEGDVLANMERWRWLPADLGERYIHVNVPEYRLRLIDKGEVAHETRVIVGKAETQTPVFSDLMDHVVVNPSWTVPPSIFKNEFHSDPAYAASRGYQVIRDRNGNVSVRQPPGERNALGFIKFMFPNHHAVYLHDTPNRSLFKAERRAFSHGCVRVDQPFRLAEEVLGGDWTEARMRALIGKGERTIRLARKLPVHLTYFTLVADEKGGVRPLPDIYGVNNKVRVALKLPDDGTKVAVSPKPKKPSREAQARRMERQAMPAEARLPVAARPFWWSW